MHKQMNPFAYYRESCLLIAEQMKLDDEVDAAIMAALIRPAGERTSHVHKAAYGMTVAEWTAALYDTSDADERREEPLLENSFYA